MLHQILSAQIFSVAQTIINCRMRWSATLNPKTDTLLIFRSFSKEAIGTRII